MPLETKQATSVKGGWFEPRLQPSHLLDAKLVRLDPSSRYLLKNGLVVDGRGTATMTSIWIEGDVIGGIGGELNPPGATAIDCTGKSILPGMMDLHIHMLGNSEHGRLESYLAPSDGERLIRRAYEAYNTLAYGFTTVRSLGHGDAEHIYALRDAISLSTICGPRIYHAGWSISPTIDGEVAMDLSMLAQLETPLWKYVDGDDECREAVQLNAARGAEVTKFRFPDAVSPGHPQYSAGEVKAIVDESHRLGQRVTAHVKTLPGIRLAIQCGIDTIEHGPHVIDREVLSMIRDTGTGLIPTMATPAWIIEVADQLDYPKALVDRVARELDGRRGAVRAAHEMGVKIGVGSDCGARAGFGLLAARELGHLVEAGFTPHEAIQAATGVSADLLGVGEELGSLGKGHLAELIVIAGDPLADITVLQDPANVEMIFQASGRMAPATYPALRLRRAA